MVSTFYPPASFGGDAIFVRQLARELVARGHEVDVVHSLDAFRALSDRQVEPAHEEPAGLRVHALTSRLGALGPMLTHQLGRPAGIGGQLRALLERDFDVVHFHNSSLMGAPTCFGWGSGIKLYTCHEAWLVCPTHTLFRYNRAPCVERRCFTCALSYRRPPQLWRHTGMLRRGLSHLDAVLSPTRTNAEIQRQRGASVEFVHLPNFVPPSERSAEPPPLPPEVPRAPFFLYVGRLETLKGPQSLPPLFRDVPGLELVVAGDGQLRDEMRRLAQGARVHLLGRQPPDVLWELYRRAVALIVPSLCYEVFPLVALEALREGTPILVRNLGSLPEIVEESGGGLIWNDGPELAGQMRRLLADGALRDRLGAAGREVYERTWTAEAHLTRYMDLIDQLQKARHGSAR